MAVLTGGGGTEPTVTSCQPVADGLLAAGPSEFQFASMPFYVVGAGSPSKLQSKPIRWLFLDEVRNYPAGALDTVLKLTRAFWNSRTVISSTPDREGDAVDRAYQAGDQRLYHIACPGCAQLQPLVWDHLKWDTNEATKPGGQWDFDRLAETIRFECKACGHATRDTPQERKALARNGRFVPQNPGAPRHRRSFKWNALLPPWVRWRSLVEEFLRARSAARNGDLAPMKTFVNESLGESWRDELGESEDFGFLLERREPTGSGTPGRMSSAGSCPLTGRPGVASTTGTSSGLSGRPGRAGSCPTAGATPRRSWRRSGNRTASRRSTA